MDIIKFIDYFNLIKPSFQEVINSVEAFSKDIAYDIYKEYDLKIISLNISNDPLMDIIENTNIASLSFSVFSFYKISSDDSIIKIGTIIEKGDLLFHKSRKTITFQCFEMSANQKAEIDSTTFLMFLLRYFELEFNRIFRENKKAEDLITADLAFNMVDLRRFVVFNDLLDEIGIKLNEL
ncbi:hypothetical protein [Mucilaginibacter gilvus]|uniref:Uncharacterized protein n=1 Tax=Mucilaginibacter gilvus TaxID=2305909 RepID=A0A444MJM7_9SPHI|nr:hypothetical protein [Mucilaginibacter gilvus]RWY48518.1 hypothetical protein EPL05_19380 [Mucilaginibacter gilvus]